MRIYILCTFVACMLCIYGVGTCVEVAVTKPSQVFYKAIPTELNNEIKKSVDSISAKDPITPSEKESLKSIVEDIHLELKYTKEQGNYIQNAGRGALPILSELLVSEDVKIRKKAQLALTAWRRPSGSLTKEFLAESEPLIILLCRRSLLDNDVQIRWRALATLLGIGTRNSSNIPAGVLAGFEQAATDPEPIIRKQTHSCQVKLGLVPREKTDIYY